MKIYQKEILLTEKRRGFHLVTGEILSQLDEIKNINAGIIHLFIKHTSASLTINENASPDVRSDMEKFFNQSVPENSPYFDHTMEGPDDMPAHIKSSIIGASLTIPISNGKLNLGTWQGIYLCEHRNRGGRRGISATIIGE
jgi:secondary thiamine-phosphate synthase enzyme